jgi:hypothetical protein
MDMLPPSNVRATEVGCLNLLRCGHFRHEWRREKPCGAVKVADELRKAAKFVTREELIDEGRIKSDNIIVDNTFLA